MLAVKALKRTMQSIRNEHTVIVFLLLWNSKVEFWDVCQVCSRTPAVIVDGALAV